MVNKNATLRENNIKHNSNLIIAYIDWIIFYVL